MAKPENTALKKAHKNGNVAQVTIRKSILSHLNIVDLEEKDNALDDYDC